MATMKVLPVQEMHRVYGGCGALCIFLVVLAADAVSKLADGFIDGWREHG